jgi:hypothetical protein
MNAAGMAVALLSRERRQPTMRKTLLASIAGLSLFLTTTAMAATPKQKTPAREKEMTYEGDIVSVSVPGNEFVVKGTDKNGPREMAFKVSGDTRIEIDGSRILFSQLERGDHVTVAYLPAGSQPTVLQVRKHVKKVSH